MLRLRLLGPLDLEHDDGRTVRSVLAQPKRFALLTHLAASHPPAARRRDTLLALFWPDTDQQRARTSLRQALYQLRRSLGPGVITGMGDELVGVDTGRLWCDAAAFGEAVEEGRPDRALELYRGPFLEGFHVPRAPGFERWMERERRRTRVEAARAAWQLVERAEAAGDAAAVRRRADRALELAPYDGESLRRYLALMERIGQSAAAVRAYEAYARRLAEDLDLEPSAETIVLAERIRTGERPASPEDMSPSPDPAPAGGPSAGTGRGEGTSGPGKDRTPGRGSDARRCSRRQPPPGPSDRREADGGRAAGEGRAPSRFSRLVRWWRRSPGRAYGATAALVVAAVLGTIAAALAVRGTPASRVPTAAGAEFAQDVVVVFPFRVSGEDDALGEGMVDLLTVKLAGTRRFRPVDPRTAVSAWQRTAAGGPPGREDLVRAARATGAGKVLDGSLVRSGSRLVLTASVVNVSTRTPVEALTVQGPADSLPGLVDELAARLLALDAGGGDRLASLTSPSLPAVRAWIRGRAAFREARYQEAAAHLERALATDSTFALAALDLLGVVEWMGGPHRHREKAERLASAGRRSLTARDRAVLDALLGPRYPDPSSLRDDLEADRRAVDLAPDSPEAWFYFGDDLYHAGELAGVDDALDRAAEAFATSLSLDSAFAGPLGHLIELAAYRTDPARVRRLLPLYLARHPGSELAAFYRWRGATLLSDSGALEELRSRWRTVPIQSLWRIVGYARFDGRGLEDADSVARLLRTRPGPPAQRAITRTILQGYYLDRGRPGEALAVQRDLGGLVPREDLPFPARPVREELVHDALFWGGDRDAAAAVVRRMERGGWTLPSDPSARSGRLRELCLAAQWWTTEEGRRPDVQDAIRVLRSAGSPGGVRARRCAALLAVMTADPGAVRETEGTVEVLDSLSRDVPSGEFSMRANLASVRALAGIGRVDRALSIAARRGPVWHRQYLAPRLRWRSRLAATAGRDDLATEAARLHRALQGPGLSAGLLGGLGHEPHDPVVDDLVGEAGADLLDHLAGDLLADLASDLSPTISSASCASPATASSASAAKTTP